MCAEIAPPSYFPVHIVKNRHNDTPFNEDIWDEINNIHAIPKTE